MRASGSLGYALNGRVAGLPEDNSNYKSCPCVTRRDDVDRVDDLGPNTYFLAVKCGLCIVGTRLGRLSPSIFHTRNL